MAVCKTIRTKDGINEFLIHSENGDENVTAFKYKDGKVEVHSLKADCPPLYLDEKTSVHLISVSEGVPSILVAVTQKHENIELRAWDVGSTQGFQQKDIFSWKGDTKKESKHRHTYFLKCVVKDTSKRVICTSLRNMLCLILDSKMCMIISFKSGDTAGLMIESNTSHELPESGEITQAMFLKVQDKLYIVLMENALINLLQLSGGNIIPSQSISMPLKYASLLKLYKITASKCLVIDSLGHLFLFSLPSTLTLLKFPCSVNGHSICSSIGFKHTNEGNLAICNNDYTINFYYLADILCSVTNGTAIFVKPYRVFCSQFPINAISFIKSDQLAMASAVNQSITFLGGLSKGN